MFMINTRIPKLLSHSSIILPSLQLKRQFSSSLKQNLLYKSQPKLEKKNLAINKIQQKQKTKEVEEEKLLSNKWYLKTPNILKPWMKSMVLHPIGFTLSFTIIHELTAIVPFVTFWYIFMKFNYIPVELPEEFIVKGLNIITDKLTNSTINIENKIEFITAGANSYALTKLLLPIRIPLSFLLAPSFDKWFIRPLGRISKILVNKFTRGKSKNGAVKKDDKPI